VLLSQMGEVSCDQHGEKFTDGVKEANWAVCFGNIIGWFAWFV